MWIYGYMGLYGTVGSVARSVNALKPDQLDDLCPASKEDNDPPPHSGSRSS
jgi:hypothetical protein